MKRLLERLLVRVVPSWAADALLGDLDEEFARVAAHKGERAAERWYAWQVVSLGARYAWHRRQPPPGTVGDTPESWPAMRSILGGLPGDCRRAIRQLARNPVFAATAILSLGLGIGANASVVAFANAVLFKPLAVHEPERLVRLAVRTPTSESAAFSYQELQQIRAASVLLHDVSAVHLATVTFRGLGVQDQVLGEIASAGYFRLRAPPALIGRSLDDADDHPSAAPAAMISEPFWRRVLGADPSVLGRSVLLNGWSVTLVGVVRDSFYGSFIGAPIDVWLPLEPSLALLGPASTDASRVRSLQLLARLDASATHASAESALNAVSPEVARVREARDGVRLQVRPGTLLHGRSRTMAVLLVTVLLTITTAVLLIAASNVANLVLARAVDRQRDLAMRIALGAGRGRLLVHLAAEALVLAAAGGSLGLLTSFWAARTFGSLALLPGFELRLDLMPDWRVAGITAAFAAVAGVAASFVPGFAMTRRDLSGTLKEGAGSVGGRRATRLRSTLVIAQIAIATVAALSAGLLTRSGRMAAATDLGFRTADTFATDIDLNALNYPPDRARAFYESLLERIDNLPSVATAALANRAPLDPSTPVLQARARTSSGDPLAIDVTSTILAGRYFDAVGVPLVAGRAFDRTDSSSGRRVAIVNDVLAHQLRPDAHPGAAVGAQLRLAGSIGELRLDGEVHVIGVARTAKYQTIGELPRPHVYLPHAQAFVSDMVLLIHTPGARPSVSAVQDTLASVDPQVQGFFPRTLEEHTRVSLAPSRLLSSASRAAGAVAAGLSGLGLYGVVTFLVSSRRREIAVRLALGATPARVAHEVLSTGVRLSIVGATIGLVVAAAVARGLSGLLYDTSPWDPIVYATVFVGVIAISLAATWIPARQAGRVDPLATLRD
jgi:predicted permease